MAQKTLKKAKAPGKAAKAPAKKPAKTAAVKKPSAAQDRLRIDVDARGGRISAHCDAAKDGIEVIRSAAYVLTDRAYALLSEGPKESVLVTLELKTPGAAAELEALARTFEEELATQRLRHQISKNNVAIREHIVEQAIRLAQAPAEAPAAPAAPAEPELSEDQRKEIERLIAEVEDEIRQMAPKRAAEDPLKISATWEESHAPKAEKAEDKAAS